MPERIIHNHDSESKKELSNPEKFEIVLKLFGTEKAKERFLGLCREYNEIRKKDKIAVAVVDSENYRLDRKRAYSPPKRAAIHNQIMEVISHLSATKLGEGATKVISEMGNREVAAKYIHEYLEKLENQETKTKRVGREDPDDDDDYKSPGRSGQSDVSYYHSLGRGE